LDIWSFGSRAQDLAAFLYSPSVPAAEQVRRQKVRTSFLELMRAVKDSDILLYAAAVDSIGNNLEKIEKPPRSFDVVGGTDISDEEIAEFAR
jgi:hypothetical protein